MLCFDILEDLSDNLEMGDYFVFVGVNDLTSELWFNMKRRYECLLISHKSMKNIGFPEHAGLFGDLEIIKWIHRNRSMNDGVMIGACKGGNFEIVRWAHYNMEKCSKYPLDKACIYGHLEIAKWLYEHGYVIKMGDIDFLIKGHSDVWMWLYEVKPTGFVEGPFDETFTMACTGGHLDVAKWIYDNRRSEWEPDDNMKSVINTIVEVVSRKGYLEVLKWVTDITRNDPVIVFNKYDISRACQKGRLEVVKWFHEHHKECCDKSEILDACYYGHLEVIKWLHHNCTNEHTDRAIHNACTAGHFDVAKWLYENRLDDDVMLSENIDYVCSICWLPPSREGDRLKLAKWLFEVREGFCTPHGLELAHKHGYVDLIKWIISTHGVCRDITPELIDKYQEIINKIE